MSYSQTFSKDNKKNVAEILDFKKKRLYKMIEANSLAISIWSLDRIKGL